MIRKLLLFALILFFVVPGALAQTAPQDDEFALVESARRMRASGNAQFNFQDVDMVKFIRFMAELLNENLVLAPGVKGSISVISPKPFPLKEARQVFISVLEMNGYTLQQGAGFGKVVPLQAGSSAESDVRTGKMGPGEGEQTVSQVVPLDYVTADFIAAAVSQASGRSVSVLPVGRGNDILLTGRATDVNRAIDLIRTLDRADKIFKSRTVKITKASPEIIAAHLANLAKVPGSPVFGLTVLPDAPGSQIVLAGEERHINRALKLIADLDVTPKSGEFHVYKLENADAKVVAEQLSKILSAQASQAVNAEGRIPTTVVPDIPSNSLIFAAPPHHFQSLVEIIQKIDTLPRQVLLRGLIAEVNLTKLNNAGIDWATWGGAVTGDAVLAGQLNMGGAGVPGNIIDWFQNISRTEEVVGNPETSTRTRTTYKGMGLVYAYLDLLKKFDAVNVLSMPRLMCTDNLPSELQVGQVIPQLKGKLSDVSNPNAVQSSYEYKDTGLILHVTPSIRSGNLVALDVEQVVEDVLTAMTAETPVTGKRKIKTSVMVSSGNTVILGGLIKEVEKSLRSRVPGLSYIPLIGGLFTRSVKQREKIELMIFLTPYILETPGEAEQITREIVSGEHGMSAPEEKLWKRLEKEYRESVKQQSK
ncbi:MAG: type II secretion system secretin GspD [Aminivibrio sp.]|uniref:type II secretion system secretin GspD n=1 Tax=Aminivibrio sp. TaxID=1872489 RepID=UPI002B20ECE3|nr:type II secretion system secretin GspD [Aminivibrio sp.]MEA4953238.1 type II secretion system secretin GspD [Aminivibrio sp.]